MSTLHRFTILVVFAVACLSCKMASPTEPVRTVGGFAERKATAEGTVEKYQDYLVGRTPEQARALLVSDLKAKPDIQNAGVGPDGITVWWTVQGGIQYCLITETRASVTDTSAVQPLAVAPARAPVAFRMAAGFPHNKKALILSPYQWDWDLLGGLIPVQDETSFINTILQNAGYATTYKVHAAKSDRIVTLNDYKSFSDYGTIAISSHGGIDKDGAVFIDAGVAADDHTEYEYLEDIFSGNLIYVVYIDKWFTKKDILGYGITPGWVRKYYPGGLTNSLFYASVCKGLYNKTLSTAMVGAGTTYFSWTETVSVPSAAKTGKDLFTQLISNSLKCADAHTKVEANGNAVYSPLLGKKAVFTYEGDPELRLVDKPIRIAVTPAGWDDMSSLLKGFGYSVTTIQLSDLSNSSTLANYDIVAINCASGLSSYATQAKSALQTFVANGGKLYTSDFAFIFVQQAFPTAVTFPSSPYVGTVQTVSAQVADNTLAGYLGVTTLNITYDLGGWVPINAVGSTTTILVEGDVAISGTAMPQADHVDSRSSTLALSKGRTATRPLAVSFKHGNGRVVYTSFHNKAQVSEPVRHILEYFTVLN